ncbi:hypothetical protein [Nocardia sp. bgisy134]|uniref:hypothetical protein n=1 Tax=Nocardia sp. bgisy134 TaxID=3413789 RepID=UPI003D75BBC1
MTDLDYTAKLVKGGLVVIGPNSGALLQIIALQYNPETLTRSFQMQTSGESSDRSQPLRISAAPIETIKLDAVLDATEQLEPPGRQPTVVEHGLHSQLAVLETLAYPRSDDLLANDRLAGSGTLEVLPIEAPLTLFVWSRSRVIPVRLTDLAVTEEAFDPALNPLRAKVSLGLRVLSVDDFGFTHRGGAIFMSHLQQKESLAARSSAATLSVIGLERLP